jgi:hypothetical protein
VDFVHDVSLGIAVVGARCGGYGKISLAGKSILLKNSADLTLEKNRPF